ncbi:Abhydrolase incomplete domain containing protein [Pandoravirus salinus]|uniref:Abhydrolase incomplete domain containing protein n=1 Tax=Pandoravirus salinus TaxID=1349410 RepID=S4W531_9VIRU|nr:Abhydrolase superfamily incomplete domain [Pandoravirus salinus]AGO85445.1 Abhydrolase incomplete domain containing protein [Pandoravirus salinus]
MDMWEEMITPVDTPRNPFDGASYTTSYETLASLRPVCMAGTHEDQYGRTDMERLADDRIVLVHTPRSLSQGTEEATQNNKVPLVLFFHGLGSHPWKTALYGTAWRRLAHQHGFIVAFAVGTDCGAQHDRRCGFRIRDPASDVAYARNIIDHVCRIRAVDESRIYCVGHSNGAIFSSVLAQRLGGDVFAAMVNVMGGFGKEAAEVIREAADKPVPLLFVTGTKDDYKHGCECAHRFFSANGYPTSIKVLDGVAHVYPAGDEEERMWRFLESHVRP